ncbi:MAG TPA: FecR domain-containing protein [Terriglobia bacterium]|nr:FecR domain-containing protein [Terriglobia bacterium]
MKPNNENTGKILDRAIEEIRNAPVSAEDIDRAAANVRHRLQEEFNKVVTHPAALDVDRIRSCEDFRALIPAYLTSSLTPSRRLLFEDHVRECMSCRKALEAARQGATDLSRSARVRSVPTNRVWRRHAKWAAPIAAALLVALALQTSVVRDWIWPIDVHAIVQMVDGGLFRVSGQDVQPVNAGQRIERGQTVRTGLDSGAMLELADGTRVEMASKSELALVRSRDGVKIKLARGNVIVAAAKQHGHLYVETSDCNVSVVGTVFAVSTGLKGSRVAVIEGEVYVEQENGTEESLLPGEQTYTNPEMGAVTITEEIAWSRNAEALWKELQTFGQDLADRAERETMRYRSNLIGLVPADTLVVASLPNVSQPFKESYLLFRQRIRENAVLSDLWQQNERTDGMNLDEIANRLAEVGDYLGSEVMFAIPKEATGRGPLVLAEVRSPDTLVSALQGDLRRIAELNGGTTEIRLVQTAEELAALSTTGLVIYVESGLMMVSDLAQVQRTAAIRRGTVANTFSSTPLYRRLEQAYGDGVGWLLAVDLRQIVESETEARSLGFENVEQLVLEQKTGIGSAASQVALSFKDERRGLPAWLGTPAPMGSLDFVSTDAYLFSAWVTKDPELILDDILRLSAADDQTIESPLRVLQETFGIDLRRDFAQPLGSEVLVALDGPILPKPSWKVVVEVEDAPRLENTIQFAITNLNRELLARGLPTWKQESETVDGKTLFALTSEGSPVAIHYASWMGYMVFTPSRALLQEAFRIHDSGTSIGRSEKFRAHLPPDGRDVASAVMYQNLESLAQSVPTVTTDVVPELRTAALFQSSLPKVVFVYGEQDRILGSARGSFGLRIASMLGLHGLMEAAGMQGMFH